MLRIALCDDDTIYCGKIIHILENLLVGSEFEIEDFSNGLELIAELEEEQKTFDLFILDLDMPVMDGIETGFTLRNRSATKNSMIIFLTNYDSNISTITDIHPFAYIKKDFPEDVISKKLNDCFRHLSNSSIIYMIKCHSSYIPIPLNTLIYVESQARHTYFHMENGDTIECTSILSKVYEGIRILDTAFVQCQKSFIVNTRFISSFNCHTVILKNQYSIPISAKFKTELLSQYARLFLNNK
ncbi:MAG: LytTR family DNA-binding domain-containing protein [Lachnospiraceae bacterium]|nr:LytTR family DNA-binding domain-containing protein [Lachnospiraceae bacterium]